MVQDKMCNWIKLRTDYLQITKCVCPEDSGTIGWRLIQTGEVDVCKLI